MNKMRLILAVSMVGALGCNDTPHTPLLRESVKTVRVAGAVAMLPLLLEAARQYMQGNPAALVIVSAEDENESLASLRIDALDVAAVTRSADSDAFLDTPVAGAVEAIMVQTQSANITNLSLEQLRNVIAGRLNNWRGLGGIDQHIALIHGPTDSGEWSYLHDILGGVPAIIGTEESTAIGAQSALLTSPGSFSILPLAYARSELRTLALDHVDPTVENARAGTYHVVVPGRLVTRKSARDDVRAFVAFVKSPLWQDQCGKLGYLNATEAHLL